MLDVHMYRKVSCGNVYFTDEIVYSKACTCKVDISPGIDRINPVVSQNHCI